MLERFQKPAKSIYLYKLTCYMARILHFFSLSLLSLSLSVVKAVKKIREKLIASMVWLV